MFWLIESHSSIFAQLQIILHQLKHVKTFKPWWNPHVLCCQIHPFSAAQNHRLRGSPRPQRLRGSRRGHRRGRGLQPAAARPRRGCGAAAVEAAEREKWRRCGRLVNDDIWWLESMHDIWYIHDIWCIYTYHILYNYIYIINEIVMIVCYMYIYIEMWWCGNLGLSLGLYAMITLGLIMFAVCCYTILLYFWESTISKHGQSRDFDHD